MPYLLHVTLLIHSTPEQWLYNMQPLLDALSSTNPPRDALNIKVLSWNINGGTGAVPGFKRGELPKVRKEIISEVVRRVNPDVILLQDFNGNKRLNYDTYEYTDSGRISASRVMYKSDTFDLLKKVHSEGINAVIRGRGGLRRPVAGEREPYQDRTSSAQLRHKETKEVINFVSFHNKRKGLKSDKIGQRASKFCAIVLKIFENEGSLVVAGVDFNCDEYHFKDYNTRVPHYASTGRRKVIDFFILTGEHREANVSAVDIFPRDDHMHAYREFFRELKRNHRFTQRNYSSILDHDPLVCELTL